MAIPQSFIQELIARTDVVEIVGRYVQLKKGGANFMGLCPFHGEKSPSFSVSPAKQFYHCFGCGKNGNVISFLMDHAGMTFIEAVKDLAGQYGMVIPEEEGSPQDKARAQAQREKQNTLTSVLEKAGEAYKRGLKESQRAIQYFKGRGLSGEIAKQFGLGYAPEGWRSLASIFPQYDDPLLVESGLVILHEAENGGEEKRYDRFRDRVMFPIRNIKGECIGFGGRVLGDEKPKYLNSPETPVFSKGRELYGLFEARSSLREHGYALVTEGYMDVVALAQLGFPNAVATLGTACTNEHVQKLFRFTDAVVFSFDGDAAGRRAARKALDGALPFATDVRSIKFLFLPAEHDPDSFIRAYGKDAFADYVSKATPLSRFLIEAAQDGCDLSSAEGRARMSSQAKPLWNQLPDGALKLQLLSEIAQLVQLPSAELGSLWSGAGTKPAAEAPRRKREAAPASAPSFDDGMGDIPYFDDDEPAGFSEPWVPEEEWKKKTEWKKEGWTPRGKGDGKWEGKWQGKGGKFGNREARPSGPLAKLDSRPDLAARILLNHSELWDILSSEDHSLLCELPAPHGELFTWLESQLHEHGPVSRGTLKEEIVGHPAEDLVQRLTAGPVLASEPLRESGPELRDLLNRMLLDRIDAQMRVLATDSANLAELRVLMDRKKELGKLLAASSIDA
ncbi:DnaG DNA primase (bacterial type) [Comamonadaceae bacterium]